MKSRSCKQMLFGGGREVGELETWIWRATWFWAASLDLQRASFAPFRGTSEMEVLGWDLQHHSLLPR